VRRANVAPHQLAQQWKCIGLHLHAKTPTDDIKNDGQPTNLPYVEECHAANDKNLHVNILIKVQKSSQMK